MSDKQYTVEKFLNTAVNLFEGVCAINSYWEILQQFKRNLRTYNNEMNCSPAFYNIIYLSLVESLYISLAKLYDWDSRSITLRELLDNADCITENNFDDSVREDYIAHGNRFQHTLSIYEEQFFEQEVAEKKSICKTLGYEYSTTTVDLSFDEMVDLYNKRFKDMQKKDIIKNLMTQRSRIYAHNDKKTNFDFDSVWEQSPLKESDLCELIDFATEYLRFYIEVLTGISKAATYVNIEDWKLTLEMVRDGINCHNEYLEKLESENI